MFKLFDADAAGIPKLVLPESSSDGVVEPGSWEKRRPSPSSWEKYRPDPLPDGTLLVDPEIHLPSIGMDVDIAYFYNAMSQVNGPFGYGRTISTWLTCQTQKFGSDNILATLTRGNGAVVTYMSTDGMSFAPMTLGVINTFTAAPDNSVWMETTPDGQTTAFPYDLTGVVVSATYAQDAIGNTHQFSYDDSTGLMTSLQDAAGRYVNYSYDDNNLLQTIQDWGGRLTTFSYDTSDSSKPLLTGVQGPTGCQTSYEYNDVPQLTKITDPNGYATNYAYDGMGRVISREVDGIGTTYYDYDSGSMTVTDVLEEQITHGLGDCGTIMSVQNPDGFVTAFMRSNGFETSRTDPLGAILTTTYDNFYNPTSTTDPLGRMTGYTRDDYNNATQTTQADGSIIQTIYGYPGSPFDETGAMRRLQVYVDPLGNCTTYTYNSNGLLTGSQDMQGQLYTYSYDSNGNLTGVEVPPGLVDGVETITVYTFDDVGNVLTATEPLGNQTAWTYDAENRVTSVTDPLGNLTQYAYDSIGNRTNMLDPLGNETQWSYNVFDKEVSMTNPLGYIWSKGYDDLGRVTSKSDPLGNTDYIYYNSSNQISSTQDPLGNTTYYGYDECSRLTSIMTPLGNIWQNVYDLAGQRIATIDPLGNITTVSYDLLGRAIAQQDPLSNTWQQSYDAASNPTALQSPLNYISTNTFDPLNRTMSNVDPMGFPTSFAYHWATDLQRHAELPTDVTSHYHYDANNRQVLTIDVLGYYHTTVYDAASRVIANIDPMGRIDTLVYDASSRLIATVDALSNCTTYIYDAADRRIAVMNARGYLTTTTYDIADKIIRVQDALGYETQYYYDTASRRIAVQDALGYLWTTVYDADSRVIAEVDPLGFAVSYVYDAAARRIATIDALGHMTTQVWDNASRLIAVQDARGYLTTFVYDQDSRRTKLINANGANTYWFYNERGDVTGFEDALYNDTDYAYNPNGTLNYRGDAKGQITNYTLDGFDREIGRLYDSSVPTLATFIYDSVGNLLQMQDTSGVSSFTYDNVHRITRYRCPSGNNYYLKYDSVGNKINELNSSGQPTATWIYDARNQPIGLICLAKDYVTYSYDALGRSVTRQLGNAVSSSSVYDPAGRLVGLQHYETAGGAYAMYTGTYDPVGNRLTQAELDGSITTYTYGSTYQILHEQRSGSHSYNLTHTYDPVGNRLSMYSSGVGTAYAYNGANELVLTTPSIGQPITTSYDANGNTLLDNAGGALTTYTWDFENRLLVLETPASVVTSTYSADGKRQKVAAASPFPTNNGYTNTCDWLGEWMHCALETGGGQTYFAMPGDWGSVLESDNGSTQYYLYDMLQNTRLMVGSSGTVNHSMIYSAFGPSVYNSAANGGDPFRQYQGELGYQRDVANLHYARNRFYDVNKARWISRDPTGTVNGPDEYLFNANDPINLGDPTGEDWLDNAANFSAGAGDSLTFGITGLAREGVGRLFHIGDVNSLVDENSGYYIGGEVAETAVEVVASGGSALLKKAAEREALRAGEEFIARAAQRAARRGLASAYTDYGRRELIRLGEEKLGSSLRSYARSVATQDVRLSGQYNLLRRGDRFVHHVDALFGHPVNGRGVRALFPSAGLPRAWNSAARRLTVLSGVAHAAEHLRQYRLERAAVIIVNRYSGTARLILNVARPTDTYITNRRQSSP